MDEPKQINHIYGEHTFATELSYKVIKNYVRSKSVNSAENSTTESGTQLASAANETSGTQDRAGGGKSVQVDQPAEQGQERGVSVTEGDSVVPGVGGNRRVHNGTSVNDGNTAGNTKRNGGIATDKHGQQLALPGIGTETGGNTAGENEKGNTEAGSTDVTALEQKIWNSN